MDIEKNVIFYNKNGTWHNSNFVEYINIIKDTQLHD